MLWRNEWSWGRQNLLWHDFLTISLFTIFHLTRKISLKMFSPCFVCNVLWECKNVNDNFAVVNFCPIMTAVIIPTMPGCRPTILFHNEMLQYLFSLVIQETLSTRWNSLPSLWLIISLTNVMWHRHKKRENLWEKVLNSFLVTSLISFLETNYIRDAA